MKCTIEVYIYLPITRHRPILYFFTKKYSTGVGCEKYLVFVEQQLISLASYFQHLRTLSGNVQIHFSIHILYVAG